MTNEPQDSGTTGGKRQAAWYYNRGDERVGPISSRELKSLADFGDMTPETLIWREGLKEWVPAKKVKGLFAAGSDVLSALERGKTDPDAAAGQSPEHLASDGKDSRAHDESGIYGVGALPHATPSLQPEAFAGPRRELVFGGSFTPIIALLPDERVLDEFEAGLWDLGLLGSLFRYKRRLVLTTHRLFRFDKKIIDNILEIVWLRSVKSVVVGQTVNGLQMALGILIALGGAVQIFAGLLDNDLMVRMSSGVFALGVGVALVILSRRKVMLVSTGEDKTGMKLVRIRAEESKRFADKIFAALADLSAGR